MREESLRHLTNCAICPNMCRWDCPAVGALQRESAAPAGKARLGVMVAKDMLQPSQELVPAFYDCLGCRNCGTWCYFDGMDLPELLNEVKAATVEAGFAPAFVRTLQKELNRSKCLYPPDQLAPMPAGVPGAKVLFFGGCAYRSMRPQAIQDALTVLTAAGVDVATLADETCCGFPARCTGLAAEDKDLARETARKIVESGASIVVTSCPECLYSFERRYPELAPELSSVTFVHFSTYIQHLIAENHLILPASLEMAVSYHDPCVLGRGLGIYEEPRQVLTTINGLQLSEARYHHKESHCCGAGNLFESFEPDAARTIARSRAAEFDTPGVEAIVTACAFCEDMLSRHAAVPVFDLAEILAAALDPEKGKKWLLRTRVETRLKADPELAAEAVTVTVEKEIVTLHGTVPHYQLAVKAGHLTGRVPGVHSVVNRITAADVPAKTAGAPAPKPPAPARDLTAEADIVIIGAGVAGCAIARELSRYDLSVVMLEKESDISNGTSKANNGMIHPGIFVEPGTLKARLNVRGVELYPKVAEELGFPYHQTGLLGIATDPKDLFLLDLIKAQAERNSVPGVEVIIGHDEMKAREPHITDRVVGGFFAPTTAMVSPYKVTAAYAENAVANGVLLYLDTPVTGIETEDGRIAAVNTPHGRVAARWVINAAGLYADEIAEMAGAPEFTIHPRKGELVLFDKKHQDLFSACLGEVTLNIDANTKGGGLMMTVDGNIEMGPTASEVPDKEDVSVSATGLGRILSRFSPLVEGIGQSGVIAYFSGLRAATYTEDFHIGPSRYVDGLIHVAGIQSPGLAAAPAIAEYTLEILKELGVPMKERPDFNPRRQEMPHFKDLDNEARQALIQKNKQYGHIVCRCEQVTEAEIVDAIHRNVPATTLDAVKRRTRAGMGRCQGGFCSPKVARILARELNIPMEAVTKDGTGSWMFTARTVSGGM